MGKNGKGIWQGVAIVLVLVLVANYMGWIDLKSITGLSMANVNVPTPTPSGGAVAGLNCAGFPVITGMAHYLDTAGSGSQAQISTGFYLYKSNTVGAIFASTATPNSSAQGLVACGDNLVSVFGDTTENTTSYYKKCTSFTVNSTAMLLDKELNAYGAPTMTIQNATSNLGAMAEIDNESFTAGGISTATLMMKVSSPTGSAQVYGSDGWALCARFASAQFATVYPAGSMSANIGHLKTTADKNTIQCWDMSSYGKLEKSKSFVFPISITAGSSVPANGSTIDYILVDKAVSMKDGACVAGFDKATDTTLGTGGADLVTVNMTRIHSDD